MSSTEANNNPGSCPVKEQFLLTYLLTLCSRILLENLTGFQLVKKFPAFYGARRFITSFTNAHNLSLSCASSIQSTSILSSHWLLCLPNDLLSSPALKQLYKFIFAPMHAKSPTNLNLLHSFTLQCLVTDIKILRIMRFSVLLLIHLRRISLCSTHAFLD